MVVKDTDKNNGASSLKRLTLLFTLAYGGILLLGCVSLYLFYSVHQLKEDNDLLISALDNDNGESNYRAIVRNRRNPSSNYQTSRRHSIMVGSSAHMVGHIEARLSRGQWLTWCFRKTYSKPTNATNCVSTLSHSDFVVADDKRTITIPKSGYYFTYAQLLTTAKSSATKGFQIAAIPGGRISEAYPVLSGYQTQYPLYKDHSPTESKESSYVGGAIFFCQGDLIGVRANPNNNEDITLDSSEEGSSYFGALILKEIPAHLNYRYCVKTYKS
ncbi:uncharacterized protein [Antedon mediterranea]|uniref:uncharacterized protein n=1 Tax=Antedon mediterranea TaxID=105859 RepID=UPI003AF4B484